MGWRVAPLERLPNQRHSPPACRLLPPLFSLPSHARRPALPPPQALQPVVLQNKAPHWNEALRCWCLNFRGRVKLASVKNFQVRGGGRGQRQWG